MKPSESVSGVCNSLTALTKRARWTVNRSEFVEENAGEARLISTNYGTQELANCHFIYAGGYEQFGKRAFWLLNTDLYGQPTTPNTTAPYPNQATLLNANQLTLTLKNTTDSYSLTGNFATDMRLEGGAGYTITNLSLNQNVLTVNFSRLPASGPAPTGLPAMGHIEGPEPALRNANNIGLINFYNLPIANVVGARLATPQAEEPAPLLLFPNPAGDQMQVHLPDGYEQANVTVLTTSGKEVSVPEQALS